METKANYVAVGAFVLACVIGLVVTVLWLAGSAAVNGQAIAICGGETA